MPYSLASTRASLDAVSPRLEEAARVARPQAARRDGVGRAPARADGDPRRRGARLPERGEGAARDAPPPPHRLRHARDGDLGGHRDRRLLAGRARPRCCWSRSPPRSSTSSPGATPGSWAPPTRIRWHGTDARPLGRRVPGDDLLPRVPDRGVPARDRVDRDRVARRGDARGVACVGRGDAEAARGGRARRARRPEGGDPHARPAPSARSGSCASTGSSSASSPTSWATPRPSRTCTRTSSATRSRTR